MDEPTIQRQIEGALAGLGPSADAIAATLGREGCAGKRKVGEGCPVYNYLNKRFPRRIYEVDFDAVYLQDGNGWLLHEDYFVDSPQPVMDFIARFDEGAYDELAVS